MRPAAVGRQVLAGRRSSPAALAGLWEFPGGKVEPGESDDAALRRECAEELGVQVLVGERIGPELALPGGRLRLYLAMVISGDVRPLAHSELRWVGGAEMLRLAWVPADGPLVTALRPLLLT